jgi:hypothetical protein
MWVGSGFLAAVWFGSIPLPLLSLSLLSVSSTGGHEHSKIEKERQLATAKKPGPL